MTILEVNNKIKSSGTLVLLLFLFFGLKSSGAVNYVFPSDTIIIGGKKVKVRQEIKYDTLTQDTPKDPIESKKKKSKIDLSKWGLGIHLQPGITTSTTSSEVAGLITVNEFTGIQSTICGYVNPALSIHYQLDDEWRLRTGIGFDQMCFHYSTFDALALHDSLYQFQTPETGKLNQVLLYRYDIGSEKDTLTVELSTEKMKLKYFTVPLVLSYDLKVKRSDFSWVFEAGVLSSFLSSSASGEIPLINTNAYLKYIGMDRVQPKSVLISAMLGAGGRYEVNESFAFFGKIQLVLPFQETLSNASDLSIKQYRQQLDVGLNIYLK